MTPPHTAAYPHPMGGYIFFRLTYTISIQDKKPLLTLFYPAFLIFLYKSITTDFLLENPRCHKQTTRLAKQIPSSLAVLSCLKLHLAQQYAQIRLEENPLSNIPGLGLWHMVHRSNHTPEQYANAALYFSVGLRSSRLYPRVSCESSKRKKRATYLEQPRKLALALTALSEDMDRRLGVALGIRYLQTVSGRELFRRDSPPPATTGPTPFCPQGGTALGQKQNRIAILSTGGRLWIPAETEPRCSLPGLRISFLLALERLEDALTARHRALEVFLLAGVPGGMAASVEYLYDRMCRGGAAVASGRSICPRTPIFCSRRDSRTECSGRQ